MSITTKSLWKGIVNSNSSITLSEKYTNYDAIYTLTDLQNNGVYPNAFTYLTNYIPVDNNNYILAHIDGRFIIKFTTEDFKNLNFVEVQGTVKEIIGIKYC